MIRSSRFVVALALVACGKAGDGGAAGKAGAGGATAGASDPNAAGAAVAPVGAITECPKSLGGPEKQHRVISKDCGVVPVTEDLVIDGGSLTLEAGASLAFKDGVGLTVGFNEPAKLIIKGTAEAPVVFTSGGDRAAGVWRGVTLHAKASRSSVEGLVIEYAGAGDEAALRVEAGEVTVTGTAIRESKTGLVVGETGGFLAFSGNEFKKIGRPAAIEAPPQALGGLGGGNRFDGGAFVLVLGGTVKKSARWAPIGAPLVISEAVGVDGDGGQRTTLELAAGLELKFAEPGGLTVGYYDNAALVVKGTADAPVTFTAQDRREAGAWSGVKIHGSGEATVERAVFEFAGRDERGALDVEGGALSLRSTTLRSDKLGVKANAAARLTAFADNTFVATPVAISLPANLVGGLGEGNGFDKDAKILVTGETVKGKTTWRAQGVPLQLEGEVGVEGELTLEAGLALLAGPEAAIKVGYYEAGALIGKGTAAAPVTIGPADTARGTWPGILLEGKSSGSSLEHLTLTGAANDSAVFVRSPAGARLDNVTCSKCSGAVVGWDCGARVSSSQVLAADGTPKIEAKPEGC
ncbi:MAG: hypothetical protein JNL82_21050 [Myxococcales bacterium]|nr:hypothetical protein [Myxococcales bacterium]